MCTALVARDVQARGASPLLSAMRTKVRICVVLRRLFVRTSLLMRTNLSTLRMPGHARGIRHPRSSKIGAAAGAIRAIINLTVTTLRENQITNPMVDAMVGIQVEAEAVNNTNSRPVTEFGEGVISLNLAQ